ncbi:hypothetical protein KDW_52990 [Dictyobacter vulcani]|uniref:PPM-type phosphatase domain-containing protein n=1 Tax=Dictyobacter vulcani TaxID=2607529 RepID=A0A5J4KX74_9CHLR|nr:PP2C family serine/threonine-protein phosphatase [Dictyobacter vulcani]GER91137.1 hypothetical protein KDW_52990 [Dictyobacter vulcani]
MASFHWMQSCSERLYQWLLLAYPSEFRREYGREMVQTFRDCYREELDAGGTLRLLPFWSTVFYDFVKSVSIEQFLHLKKLVLFDKEYQMLNAPLHLQVAQLTDIGRTRPTNEDNLIAVLPDNDNIMRAKGALFVVADGMGGHSYGELASELAVKTIQEVYYQDSSNDIPTALGNALRQANTVVYETSQAKIRENSELSSKTMGTTCVAMVLNNHTLYVANAGDSLAYLITDQEIKQLAENHSLVAQEVLKGNMTAEEALTSPSRNVITRCLGTKEQVEVYLSAPIQVKTGDILLLCTDGLHGLISETEIRLIVENNTPEESSKKLIERANENGGPDNITAIVVKID